MLEGFKKFTRALKRDYLPATYPDGSGPFSRQLAICLGITWGLCLPLFIIFPAVCAWTPILGLGASATVFFDRIREIRKDMAKRTAGEMTDVAGATITLSGPGPNICLIENTQKLVNKMAAGHENVEELPAHVQAKLAPYFGDGAEAASAVKASLKGEEQPEIPLLRPAFKGATEKGIAIVAALLTPLGIERKRTAEYNAAVAAQVAECQDGLSQNITVKRLRLKTGAGA